MGNALTLRTMSPGLRKVVRRATITSHIGGRAVCRKSARTALVRGRDRVTARPTLQALFRPASALGAPVESASPPRTARRRLLLSQGAGGNRR